MSVPYAIGGAYAMPAAREWTAVVSDACVWDSFEWEQLPPNAQRAWATLGWSQQTWNSDNPSVAPRGDTFDWAEMTKAQRDAAISLGYNQRLWDFGRCEAGKEQWSGGE